MTDGSTGWTLEYARAQMHDGIERLIDGLVPGNVERIATDGSAFDEVIAVTALAVSESEALLQDAVTSARQAGRTWTEIGTLLGISRQEAQSRFTAVNDVDSQLTNSTSATSAADNDSFDIDLQKLGIPLRRLLRNLKPDDIDALNRAGKFGWHSIKVALTSGWTGVDHTVELSDQQWEHTTTGFFKKMPADQGWIRLDSPTKATVGVAYWARPLDIPALPGQPDPEHFVLK